MAITLVTADAPNAGTDDGTVALCLPSRAHSFPLATDDIDDTKRGELGGYHAEGGGLAGAGIDRVEVRTLDGANRWEPSYLAVQFDGAPNHCSELPGMFFGESRTSWRAGATRTVHAGCASCFPDLLTHGPMSGAPEPDG